MDIKVDTAPVAYRRLDGPAKAQETGGKKCGKDLKPSNRPWSCQDDVKPEEIDW